MEPIFTVDWFTGNIPIWSKLLREFHDKEVHALDIGSFQGRSTRWLLENILTHEASKITCVDTFEGSKPYTNGIDGGLLELFQHNTEPFKDKVIICQGKSQKCLRDIRDMFDFVYIDGDHDAAPTLGI
jgi:predicted O-methyltransferase YrrM